MASGPLPSSKASLLALEIEGPEPVTGRLYDRRGEPHPFTGWMELASLIAAQIPGAPPAPTATDGGD